MPIENNLSPLTEIGISYNQSLNPKSHWRPYFIKQVESYFVTFLRNHNRRAVGYLSLSTGEYIKIRNDVECEYLTDAVMIDCDEAGRLYILSEHEKKISIVNNEGVLSNVIPLNVSGRPISIRYLSNGLLLIGTWKPGGVCLLDCSGRLLWKFYPGEPILKEVRSVFCTPSNHFYIADADMHCVLVVTETGEIVKKFGTSGCPGYGTNRFANPAMIEPSEEGTLLLCDTRNNRVINIDDSGDILWEWPFRKEAGSSSPELLMPWCVRQLNDSGFIIADTFNFRIFRLDSKLEVKQTYGFTPVKTRMLSFPRSVQHLNNDRVLVADTYNNRVVELDVHSHIRWQFSHGTKASLNYELFWPRCALRLKDGSTIIADSRNDRILFVTYDGTVENIISHVRIGSTLSSLKDPHDIILSPSGNFLIVDTGNDRILEIDYTGACLWTCPEISQCPNTFQLSDPHQVTIGDNNDLLISDTGNNRVLIYNRDSDSMTQLSQFKCPGTEEKIIIKEPRGCYFRDDHFWILDSGNSRIIIVNKDSEVIRIWNGVLDSSPLPYVFHPRWFTVTSSKRVFISDYFNSRIILIEFPLT